jgi:hypothetical protein
MRLEARNHLLHPVIRSPPRRLALELDATFFLNRCLLDRDHLAFHLSEFGRRLFVASDKERRRPEDHTTAAAVASPSFVRF